MNGRQNHHQKGSKERRVPGVSREGTRGLVKKKSGLFVDALFSTLDMGRREREEKRRALTRERVRVRRGRARSKVMGRSRKKGSSGKSGNCTEEFTSHRFEREIDREKLSDMRLELRVGAVRKNRRRLVFRQGKAGNHQKKK